VAGGTKCDGSYILHLYGLSDLRHLQQVIKDDFIFKRVEIVLISGLLFNRGSSSGTVMEGTTRDMATIR
jgi:hypothetical protein